MISRREKRTGRAISIKSVLILLAGGLVLASTFVVTLLLYADHKQKLTENAFRMASMALSQQQTLLADVFNEQKRTSHAMLASFNRICEEDVPGDQAECLSRQLETYAEERPAKRAILTIGEESVGWGDVPQALLDYPPLGEAQLAYFNLAANEPSYIIEVASDEDILRVEYELQDILEVFSSRIPETVDDTWLIAPDGEWIYSRHDQDGIQPDFLSACLAGESGETVMPIEEKQMLMVYRDIPEIGGGCLNVSLSQARALGGRMAFGHSLLGLISLLTFCALLLAVFIARHVTRPIDDLRDRAEGFMTGDLLTPVRIHGPKEIRLFGEAFEKMARHIASKSREIHQKADSLQRALASRDQFLSYASHELNTPLTVLKLRIQVIAQYGKSGRVDWNMLHRTLHSAEDEVERLIRLVSTLFDVNRAQLGKLTLDKAACDLAEILNAVVERFEGQLQVSHTPIHLDVPPSLPGEWDRSRLEQVFFNLIGNAIKFGEGNPIQIGATADDRHVTVRITDHGGGIAAEDLENIFKVYEQSKNGQKQGGMGLGLFISAEIVRAHDGSIEVHSDDGQGATFSVILPRH